MTVVSPTLSTDRAAGVLLGCAVGDALGAGYEFTPAASLPDRLDMIGGGLGGFAPGEWTDDTAMAIGVAELRADGRTVLLHRVQAQSRTPSVAARYAVLALGGSR